MTGYYGEIEKLTLENENFRKVVFTGTKTQLVLMCLGPNEDIGSEVHLDVDQFFRFESGEGKVVINGEEYEIKDGDAVVVPGGSRHNVINTSSTKKLKLYTLYSPPNHPEGTIHKNKMEADEAESHEDH